jgi:CDP-2,3-bis-(O-geranylgeranyl)-sn-glycerol synthase
MTVEARVLQALWFILPAYFANSMPVQFSKVAFLEKYGKPIDGGRTWMGARILGDGKTWRGLVIGVTIGSLIGVLQLIYQKDIALFFGGLLGAADFTLPIMSLQLAFMLSLGALAGDMVASFFKRRTGLHPGEPAPLMDQLDFVFGAFLFSWFLLGTIDYDRFFILVVITPILHLIANFVAWIWKLKKNPW